MELGDFYDKGLRVRRRSIGAEGLLEEMKYNVTAQARPFTAIYQAHCTSYAMKRSAAAMQRRARVLVLPCPRDKNMLG